MVSASPVSAQNCGSPGTGDCFSANGTAYCNDQTCCENVCASDAFCCNTEWDSLCAGAANEICCGGSDAGDCFSANGTPSCNEGTCCEIVCALDPFCCDVEWDSACANQAANSCQCGGSNAGDCFSANGTPYCNNGTCCENVCASDAFCCNIEWDSLCASAADDICCGGSDAGDCFSANGTPSCNDGTCCEIVCTLDPFCCNVAWDSACASQAMNSCQCGGSDTGDCFSANGTPYCSDGTCCDTVCAADPFCCDTTWDNICATSALDDCLGCGGVSTGSCTVANNSPHCDDEACCETVCQLDPFCCNTAWDGVCASTAAAECCPADLNGDGVVNVFDLLELLNTWGPCPGCPADLNGDGVVNVFDLLELLNSWGPCS